MSGWYKAVRMPMNSAKSFLGLGPTSNFTCVAVGSAHVKFDVWPRPYLLDKSPSRSICHIYIQIVTFTRPFFFLFSKARLSVVMKAAIFVVFLLPCLCRAANSASGKKRGHCRSTTSTTTSPLFQYTYTFSIDPVMHTWSFLFEGSAQYKFTIITWSAPLSLSGI